jgi:hypothetical protein
MNASPASEMLAGLVAYFSVLLQRHLLTHGLNFSYRAAAMTQMVRVMQMQILQIRLLTLWIGPECGEGEVCLR